MKLLSVRSSEVPSQVPSSLSSSHDVSNKKPKVRNIVNKLLPLNVGSFMLMHSNTNISLSIWHVSQVVVLQTYICDGQWLGATASSCVCCYNQLKMACWGQTWSLKLLSSAALHLVQTFIIYWSVWLLFWFGDKNHSDSVNVSKWSL